MKLKVNYNIKAISVKDIMLLTGAIKSGEPFELVDAYKENDSIFIGIKTSKGIQEAGFKIPKGKSIESRKDLTFFVESFIAPYFENCTYTFIHGS
jgi:hypothetical protein